MKKFDFLFSQFDEKVSEVFKQGKDSTWFLLYKDHSVGPEKPGTGLLQSLRKRQWYFKKNWIIVDLQCCINFSCSLYLWIRASNTPAGLWEWNVIEPNR